MPAPFMEGAEFALSFYGITHFWKDMSLSVSVGDRVIPVLSLEDGFRIDDVFDATITLTGYHGTQTGQGDFKDLLDAQLDRTAPDTLAWTDTANTPVSMLTAKFFARFPKNTWRISEINSGPKAAKDPLEYQITLKPKYTAQT